MDSQCRNGIAAGGPTITWFSFELLAPLLDGRISVAERMLCHFRVAVTLLHEFSVST